MKQSRSVSPPSVWAAMRQGFWRWRAATHLQSFCTAAQKGGYSDDVALVTQALGLKMKAEDEAIRARLKRQIRTF